MLAKDFTDTWPATTSDGIAAARYDADLPTMRKLIDMDPACAQLVADWCRKEELVDRDGFLVRSMVLRGHELRMAYFLCESPYSLRQYVGRVERLQGLSQEAYKEGPELPHPVLDISNPR